MKLFDCFFVLIVVGVAIVVDGHAFAQKRQKSDELLSEYVFRTFI